MSLAPHLDQLREEWLKSLEDLMQKIELWADSLGWATRRIELSLEDSQLGKYAAPALLLQSDAVRIMVEPIARQAPGVEGVVDLYLMPAYDDLATLYLIRGSWHLHYMFSDSPIVGDIREAESSPLTKETMDKLLREMKDNAISQN